MKNIFIVILLFSTYCYGQYIPQSRKDTVYTHGVGLSQKLFRPIGKINREDYPEFFSDSATLKRMKGVVTHTFNDTVPIDTTYAIDSLPVLIKGVLPDMYTLELNLAKYHYATADRLWLNYDSTKYMFRYLVRETPFYFVPTGANRIIKTPVIAGKGVIISDTTINGMAVKVFTMDTSYKVVETDTITFFNMPYYEEIDSLIVIENPYLPDSLGITLHSDNDSFPYPRIDTIINSIHFYKYTYTDSSGKQRKFLVINDRYLPKRQLHSVKERKRRTDTTSIAMLVADTSRNRPMNFIKEPAVIGGVTYSETPLVYWTFGYSVGRYSKWRKRWKHSHFLDIHKKPLSVNIFIWQVKERKK